MVVALLHWAVLVGATLPLLSYLIATYSARHFFLLRPKSRPDFAPPVSVLKPVRGLDREAYANFVSFCRQDYPQYEILFGVEDLDDPVVPVIQKLIRDFPGNSIRLLIGPDHPGTNSKVSKLCRLANEARHEILVISDSDIRVRCDYLRTVVGPLRNSQVGVVTCSYVGMAGRSLGAELEAVGLATDFFAGVIMAWQLEEVKFALGATMAVPHRRLAEIGGFEALADCLSDDFELGNRMAMSGYRVELLSYTVSTVLPSQSLRDLFQRQLRWAVGLRHSRAWGHLGLLLTQGLPWSLAAVAVGRSVGAAVGYLGAYVALRLTMAWTVGIWGLRDPLLRRKWWLVFLWDAVSFVVWLTSFTRNRISWRGAEFYVCRGGLIPVTSRPGTVEEPL
jgi:ceramide glucosyltransferase